MTLTRKQQLGFDPLEIKINVRVATVINGTFSTDFANGQTIDGVTLATNDRILIKDQNTATENGIYIVNVSGAPTRATDSDTSEKLVGASTRILEGTENQNRLYNNINTSITIGVTNIIFRAPDAARDLIIPGGTISRVGSVAGWLPDESGTNNVRAKLNGPSAQFAKLMVPILGLKQGDVITGFHILGFVSSSANVFNLDTVQMIFHPPNGTGVSVGQSLIILGISSNLILDKSNTNTVFSQPKVVEDGEVYFWSISASADIFTEMILSGLVVHLN